MKTAATKDDFVQAGMTAVEAEFAKPRTSLASVITIPTHVYEGLLKSAFLNQPLFTGKKDGNNRPIRYDPVTKLLYSKEDGRMLLPMKLVSHLLGNDSGPMSNFGAELGRRAREGRAEEDMFKYDTDKNYLGVEVNGKIMGPDELHKPYNDGICPICQATANKKCSGCKMVSYCSVECQRKDWVSHKKECKMVQDAMKLHGN